MTLIPEWIRWCSNRTELIISRACRGRAIQVLRIDGVDYVVDHRCGDIGSLRACRPDGAYGRFVSAMHLPPSPAVLDLGANIGGFPLLMRRLGHVPSQLTCVELNPITHAKLLLNISSQWPSATVLNAGVTADGRTLEIDLGPGSTSDSIYRSGHPRSRHFTVPGRTLAEVALSIDGVIDVLKIDIEHAEHEALCRSDTASEALARVRHLLIEIHPAQHLREISDRIETSGLRWMGHESGASAPGLGVNWFARA